jgi:hypothetical protein
LNRAIPLVICLWIGVTATVGCGLYESPPKLEEVGPCGICGPCGLGLIDCATEGCIFDKPWEGVLTGEMECGDIVVVAEGAPDHGEGVRGDPVGTIARAMELAVERDASVIALAADGVWHEAVAIDGNLSLVGGVDEYLRRAVDLRPKLKWESDDEHVTALTIEGNTETVWVVGLDVEGRGGMTNYGVRVVDGDVVVLRDLKVVAGPGGDGADGDDGIMGISGSVGGDGGYPSEWSPGAGGVNQSCPQANGGDGGQGEKVDVEPAQRGEDSSGGAVGRWGRGADGQSGEAGSKGHIGEKSSLVQGLWTRGGPAGKGERGKPGVGGGGGGGGSVSDTGVGGGGGAGGAGGCGGTGGQGGENGGSSIGVLVQGSDVRVFDSRIISSNGGDGGVGGMGGPGGLGRPGGEGAGGVETGNAGADGGHGGDGGAGGGGGGGRGGNSFSFLCGEEANIEINKVLLENGDGGLQFDGHADSSNGRGCNL